MDRVSLVKGRFANPTRVGEAVMNAQAASEMGVHIGSVIQIPFYTDAQTRLPNPDKPFRILKIKLVGEIVQPTGIVDSDFDALGSPAVIFSPALTRLLAATCATGTLTSFQLQGGDASINRVFSRIERIDPNVESFGGVQVTSDFVPAVQQAIEPEAVALGAFGGIAGLAVLLIVALMIGRILRVEADETRTLRALGANRLTLRADQLIGVLGAVVLGAVLAVVVAFSLSGLSPSRTDPTGLSGPRSVLRRDRPRSRPSRLRCSPQWLRAAHVES